MRAPCPRCKTIHDVPDGQESLTIHCGCGEEFFLTAPPRKRASARRKPVQCSRCNRIYDPRELVEGKKICLTCGTLIVLKERQDMAKERGERQIAYARTEMRALIEMCTLMNTSFDHDRVLGEIMRISTDILYAEGSSLILLDEDKDSMIFYVTTGDRSEELKKVTLQKGEGIAGHVLATRKPLIVNNTRQDPRFCDKVDSTVKFTTRNLLCVPLFAGKRITGVLEVVNKLNNEFFDEYDLKIAEAIAGQAGLAIEKSRFIEESIKSERLVAVGQTISNISFCIKHILTSLEGWSSMLDMAIQEKDHENIGRSFSQVRTNISRISNLVMDMLFYTGAQEKNLVPADLQAIMSEVQEVLREEAAAKGVKITASLDGQPGLCYVTPQDIYRCFFNLVTNAIEACPPAGGSVEIAITFKPESGLVFVEISDNGEGIPPENLEKIFSVFFTTRGYGHSGLGLAISRKIAEDHGGGIVVESQRGRGARFLIRIAFLDSPPRR
ncbi:MAG: GAF domain-containing sensor histidine kinase [Candidatus Eremiobacteraeota bacterium]|nr:GAF domain-containing sensor histidine kinase [Candidatus Eremiobacteraeota bacterium]